jgi:hypothetical protein
MEYNVTVNQNNDFSRLIKKSIIIQIIFIYYNIYIYISFYIFRVRIAKESNNEQKYSTIDKLKFLTYNEKSDYEGAKNCLENNPDKQMCIYQFLCPKEVQGKTRILLGDRNDGSYVLLNDFENIKIAYSIGIRDIIQFDKALSDKGIDVYMYDHTVKNLPYKNNKLHFKKIGLGGNDERSYNIQTLEDMMKENGHIREKNMILKMDIESNEWKPLYELSKNILNQFKYILIEYHFRANKHKIIYDVLKKIHKTHQVFYVHCSPDSKIINFGNNKLCSALEVSYIIRKGNVFSKDKSIYPIQEFSHKNMKKFNVNILKLFNSYGK